jgi:hypothetical protein
MDGSAWQVLRDLQAWQITQIPRRPHARQDSSAGQDQTDRGASQRLQALVSAFHYGAPVAFGWIREHPGGPVRVLAAGPALARMPCWLQLAGITDPLLASHDTGRQDRDSPQAQLAAQRLSARR